MPVKSSVARSILLSIYENCLKNKECLPMEELPEETKEKYWEYACTLFIEKEKRTSVCKTMYALDLITGTIN